MYFKTPFSFFAKAITPKMTPKMNIAMPIEITPKNPSQLDEP